jgi:hypothetical protein
MPPSPDGVELLMVITGFLYLSPKHLLLHVQYQLYQHELVILYLLASRFY